MVGARPSTPDDESIARHRVAVLRCQQATAATVWNTTRSGRGRHRATNRGSPKSHLAADCTARHQPLRRILGVRVSVRPNLQGLHSKPSDDANSARIVP